MVVIIPEQMALVSFKKDTNNFIGETRKRTKFWEIERQQIGMEDWCRHGLDPPSYACSGACFNTILHHMNYFRINDFI